MHVLETVGLSKNYGSRNVARNIDIAIKSGEIVGLLGPNGAGKTTTFHMITGMIRHNSGSILYDSEDISQLPMYLRARKGIKYLPQEPSIFRKLTVRENLRAVLEINSSDAGPDIDTRVEYLLKLFNLTEFSSRDGHRLSGGERRRTEIARAIALNPTFILFDEPFAGIDPIAIIELKKMLTGLKNEGIGILITDHNVRDTLSITDRAYIISNGGILEKGEPGSLIANPKVKDAFLGEEFKL